MNFSITEWLEKGIILSQSNGQVLLGWGDFKWDSKPDPHLPSFYFPDFFLENPKPWLISAKHSSTTIANLILELKQLPSAPVASIDWSLPEKAPFSEGFYKLQELFQSTPLEKAVIYGFSKAPQTFTSAHRKQMLLNILNDASLFPLHIYGFWNHSHEGILGATPEVLFDHQSGDKTLHTMALAGTQKIEKNRSCMTKNLKLLHEHNVVTLDICNKLKALGTVHTGNLQVLQLPLLSHLYTPLSVHLSVSPSFRALVDILHPTPALGGFPRQLAANWLKAYNTFLPRGRFGAPVGFVDPKSSKEECYVAIRNIMWDNQSITIGAGCGVVTESHLETEWEELILKTQSIKRFLEFAK